MSGEELLERIRFRQPITKGYLMDEDEEILVSPRGDISVGLPILYPWEEEDRKKPETARRTPKPLGTARTKRASKPATVAIVIFLGGLGIHRFLAGKTGTGILWLLTIGCLGIGWIVDIIQVSAGRFTQKDGMLWGTG